MRIYRVEGPDGIGPYQTREAYRELCDFAYEISVAHSGNAETPAPWADGIGEFDDDERCGFKSPDDLKCWFAGWLRRLRQAGYVVVIYEVPDHDVRIGGHQVVFRPGRRIGEKSVLARVDTLAQVR